MATSVAPTTDLTSLKKHEEKMRDTIGDVMTKWSPDRSACFVARLIAAHGELAVIVYKDMGPSEAHLALVKAKLKALGIMPKPSI